MAAQTETIQVDGVRCEQCVMRLGGALQGVDGLESANADLTGRVTLVWDDERVRREEIVDAMTRAGFPAS